MARIRILRFLGQYPYHFSMLQCSSYSDTFGVWQSNQPDDMMYGQEGKGKGQRERFLDSTPPLRIPQKTWHILRHHDPPRHQPQEGFEDSSTKRAVYLLSRTLVRGRRGTYIKLDVPLYIIASSIKPDPLETYNCPASSLIVNAHNI